MRNLLAAILLSVMGSAALAASFGIFQLGSQSNSNRITQGGPGDNITDGGGNWLVQ